MKTLEFKLDLNLEQQAKIDGWLEIQRLVWNKALEVLKEFEAFSVYDKASKTYAPCCPINWNYRYIPNPEKTGYICVPFSRIGFKPKYGDYVQSCQVPQCYREPALIKFLVNSKTNKSRTWQSALMSLFSQENNPWLKESGCHQKIVQGTIKLLTTSWETYKKGKCKSPKFKRFGDFKTLNDFDAKTTRHIGNDRIQLPRLGAVRVKGSDKRWRGLVIQTYRITKEPSGYYLLLVGEVPERIPKLTDKACGIDPGVKAAVTLDDGRQYKPANPLKCYMKRLKRLQRKLSRQVKQSKGWQKTKVLIAKLHEKIRRTRKAFNHKLSTKLVREYGAIAFEGTQLTNMVRRPKAKLREDGKGYEHNRAAQKAGLNRSLLDVAIGQCRTMIETKCKAWDREFTKPKAQNTSITCNKCGVIDKVSRLSQSVFKCTACGNEDNADANASKNILDVGLTAFKRSYRCLERDVKRVEQAKSAVKPEDGKPSPSPEYGEQSFPQGTIFKARSSKPIRAPELMQLSFDFDGCQIRETG